MQIPVNNRYSTPAVVNLGSTITAPEDVVVSFQGSQDGLNWESVANNRFLPANSPTIIPPSLTPFKQFRLAVEPQPVHRVFTVSAVATPPSSEDLVVPDLIKTRSTQIERDESGNISKVKKVGGREVTITRDESGNVAELNDASRKWTVGRSEAGDIEEVVVE